MNIKQILNSAKNIAIVGLSPNESKPSNIVGKYLLEQNFNIFPIYPKFDTILNQKVYRDLDDINTQIDIVVVFRKGVYAKNLLQKCIQHNINTLWLQLGITNDEASQIAKEKGINFIQDKCIMIEHKAIKGQ
ncbi:CoA-binding protein [Campylobacter sp. RM12327]|uniref:CoA-binding protein n=1 Tax=Campylobacter sputorum TaxID=206 RepID=UPI000B771F5D|nr:MULTISPECIES: CoA-binding protein [Campylobacter]ASM40348.1 CoA-binding domain protein [Campylobacter sputorum]MBE7357379.1 CoA-binding protein [Campylobacter sp. RM11302]MBF6668689.1 CoA-binding protein [Campylobacter sp. RM12327]MBF6674055.1 CoA-binding protein [Campylobacter sp. RM13538]MBF6675524.1 CoA-binding protein [Campylobacter sp. RM12321]